MTLLCIGDSNTYGYDPRSYFGDRYPADVRWTERLGTWKTVNCGMNGLAVPFNHTVFTDLIRSNSPDVVAVMLGTNDLLEGSNAETTAKRMEAFLTDIKDICPKLLLIAPPPMQPGEWVQSQKQIDESVKLGQEYCELAKKLEIYYADAGEWHAELAYDGVHFTPKGHKAFAEGLCAVLNRLIVKPIKEYRNIVFDMGGVLVDYTADNATWHFTDDPDIVREIHNVMFCSQEWMALDMGSMTDEKAINRILPRLSSDKVREIARITFEHWHEFNNVERPGMARIIQAIKNRGQHVYILSNVSRRLTNTYKQVVPAPDLYDGAFFSGEVLALKPQPIIYQMFFERFGLEPSECFFIDDVPENTDAAIQCGMDAWCFDTGNNKDLERILEIDPSDTDCT